jgi:hypothetical protein
MNNENTAWLKQIIADKRNPGGLEYALSAQHQEERESRCAADITHISRGQLQRDIAAEAREEKAVE